MQDQDSTKPATIIAWRPKITLYHGKPGQSEILLQMLEAHGDSDECLVWPFKRRKGFEYGVVRYDGEDWRVHRLAYKITNGRIYRDLVVMHAICDNPPCFNRKHIKQGTNEENRLDMRAKGRQRPPINPIRGEDQWKSKLTADKVMEIRRLFSLGDSKAALGRMFGVTDIQIKNVVNRVSWKHIL